MALGKMELGKLSCNPSKIACVQIFCVHWIFGNFALHSYASVRVVSIYPCHHEKGRSVLNFALTKTQHNNISKLFCAYIFCFDRLCVLKI